MKNIRHKNMKWWVGIISCMAFFAGIGVFAYMKMDFVLHGVAIKATVDTNTDSSVVEVKGTAANATYLTLNGREIDIDRNGGFDEPVALLPGLGVVTLNAKDKFGNVSQKQFEIIYKEDNSQVALVNK
jgi:hypothetical protein